MLDVLAVNDVLAVSDVNNFGDTRSGGLAGPMGLFLIVLMCVATVLLIRNMNKRIRRLPDSFPVAGEPDRVAEIARSGDEGGPGRASAPEGVEADRLMAPVATEDPEVPGLRGQESGSASTGGAERS